MFFVYGIRGLLCLVVLFDLGIAAEVLSHLTVVWEALQAGSQM